MVPLTRGLQEQDFDYHHWARIQDTRLLTGGRGRSQKIVLDHAELVLRQYLRGGLVAKFLVDRYLWTGLKFTRPYRENLAVQSALRAQLPVPEVIAFRVARQGLFYRAAIITRYVPNQGTLASVLTERKLAQEDWHKLGRLLRRLHNEGIAHADLNANNILIREHGEFCLIDFDKARTGVQGKAFAHDNLKRLLRSLHKIERQHRERGEPFQFRAEDWDRLLAGYHDEGR